MGQTDPASERHFHRRSAESFGEELLHCAPRSLVTRLVVLNPLNLAPRRIRICEAMPGRTISDDLPVGARFRHLLGECVYLRDRDSGIVRAGEYQQLGLDLRRTRREPGLESAMKSHHRRERRPLARKLEDEGPAEAIADRGDAVAVDLGQRA
jgi:hypothetical protein